MKGVMPDNLIERVATFPLFGASRRVRALTPVALFVVQRLVSSRGVPEGVRRRLARRAAVVGGHLSGTVALRDGFAMKVVGEDMIQRRILLFGARRRWVWEPQSLRLMSAICRRAKFVVVAGGHVGYVPLLAAKAMAARGGTVAAFEPNPRQCQQMRENCDLNPALPVTVDQRALFDADGERLRFFCNTDLNVRSSAVMRDAGAVEIEVETVTLDRYCEEAGKGKPDLLVLDVEGAELEALRGGRELIGQPPEKAADLILEFVPGRRDEAEQQALLDLLAGEGYELYMIDDPFDYDYDPGDGERAVGLCPVRPAVASVAQAAERLGLADPNLFATKRPLSALEELGVPITCDDL